MTGNNELLAGTERVMASGCGTTCDQSLVNYMTEKLDNGTTTTYNLTKK